MNIISYILDQQLTTVLEIQQQIVDEGKSLDETAASQELEKDFVEQRKLFERRLEEAQQEMKDAIAEGNRLAIEEAAEQQQRFQKKLDEVVTGSDQLKVSMQKLLEQKDAEYRQTLKDLEFQREETMKKTLDATDQLERLRMGMKLQDEKVEDDRRRHQKDMDEMSLKMSKERLESQESLQKLMIDQERQIASTYAASVYSSERKASPPTPGFRQIFAQAAGESVGDAVIAVGPTSTVLAASAAAALCVVM